MWVNRVTFLWVGLVVALLGYSASHAQAPPVLEPSGRSDEPRPLPQKELQPPTPPPEIVLPPVPLPPVGEAEKLFDLTTNVAFEFEQAVLFTHARKTRRARIGFGWLHIRLPETQHELWVLVAHDFERDHDLVLLTNVPLENVNLVRQVYSDWRQRAQIEHGYRFEQEEGLDVEDLRVETLERMWRVFLFVLLAAQFVCHIDRTWNAHAVRWLRLLGGKLDLDSDCDGLYILLRGIAAVWQAAATMTFVLNHPFPAEIPTYG